MQYGIGMQHQKDPRTELVNEGIDAPEKAQPFGNGSKQELSYWVYDRFASVEFSKRDRYGCIVGKVMVASPYAFPAVQPDCPKTLYRTLTVVASAQIHYLQATFQKVSLKLPGATGVHRPGSALE